MISTLWDRTNYTQDLSLLKSCNIYEYDISKANINMLYYYGKLTKEQYEVYKIMDNQMRKISIGLMERENRELIKIKADGIRHFKKLFFEEHNLQDSEILTIKNDAIFVMRKLYDTKFDNVEFTLRNKYTLFCRVFRHQFFYSYDPVNQKDFLHIKGMKNEQYELHEKYMIDFIKYLFKTFQTDTIEETLTMLRIFYENYINRRHEPGYYRELDSGTFRLVKLSETLNYSASIVTKDLLPYIVIDANAAFLRELSKIFYTEYLRGK